MERLIEAVAGDRVLITVVGRDQPHSFPFRGHRIVFAGMPGDVAVLCETEEPRQFRHLFAGRLVQGLFQHHPVSPQVGTERLLQVVLRHFIAPGRQIEHEGPVAYGPVACDHVAHPSRKTCEEGIFIEAQPVGRALALGQVFTNGPPICVVLATARLRAGKPSAQIDQHGQCPSIKIFVRELGTERDRIFHSGNGRRDVHRCRNVGIPDHNSLDCGARHGDERIEITKRFDRPLVQPATWSAEYLEPILGPRVAGRQHVQARRFAIDDPLQAGDRQGLVVGVRRCTERFRCVGEELVCGFSFVSDHACKRGQANAQCAQRASKPRLSAAIQAVHCQPFMMKFLDRQYRSRRTGLQWLPSAPSFSTGCLSD